MKFDRTSPRSPDTFDKWSDQHRAQVWDMIERLAKGEVSHKEAREVLRLGNEGLERHQQAGLQIQAGPGPQVNCAGGRSPTDCPGTCPSRNNGKLLSIAGLGNLVPIRTKGPRAGVVNAQASSTRRIAPRSANAPKRLEAQPAEPAC